MGRIRLWSLFIVFALLVAACNPQGDQAGEGGTETVQPTATATASAPASEGGAAGAVSTLEGVEEATVQIVAQGSFVDPEVGLVDNAAGAGSGFLVDPSGIAVTNNHVVTGAATIEVYLSGDDEPVNARVLGVSECSDLAVIDLEGEDYPFLQFHEGEIDTGLDIYAAGYPLGDPEFTLTRGIVSKAEASGETNWASVDGVIEHDARINPGNSGGPLVDADGRVVAVNYASDPEATQYFAIATGQTQEIIDQLREGDDVNSIGVNGTAVVSEDETLSGIWVASVETGSPADNARIVPGDIITRMENLVLATDGTMREYCDILRSRDPSDPIAVEVLRYNTSEVLTGQLNGRELEQSFSFADELEQAPVAGTAGDATYAAYQTITDDTQAIQVDVPTDWAEVDGRPYVRADGIAVTDVRAAPNLQSFQSSWDTPGMIFTASSQWAQSSNENAVLDELVAAGSQACVYEGRQPYQDPAYTGSYDIYTNCGGIGVTYVVVGAVPPDRSYVIRVEIQANAERDFEALDRILRSFVVTGQV